MDIITSTAALERLCSKLAERPFVALDTEFMRDKTFWSKLCLVQVAADDIEAIIDPLADIDLGPLLTLLGDTRSVKVFHAARQDVEIFYHLGGVIPAPLFDTQIAAMVCGFGDSIAYGQLVRRLTDARIDKASRFTDWARRPLSEGQLDYALADVTHLREVYAKLAAELERSGRTPWMQEEVGILISPETYQTDPERAWERVKAKPRSRRAMALLIELAAWREREAQATDQPRSRVLKDEVLVDIATHDPKDAEELGRLRSVPRGFERSRAAGSIVAALERGRARNLETIVVPEGREPLSAHLEPVLDLLRVVLRLQSNRHKVAPRLIATTSDLEEIARSDQADVPALAGWRRELFGQHALDVKHGRSGLAVRGGKVVLTALAPAADAEARTAEPAK
jgi:ribonuclease D